MQRKYTVILGISSLLLMVALVAGQKGLEKDNTKEQNNALETGSRIEQVLPIKHEDIVTIEEDVESYNILSEKPNNIKQVEIQYKASFDEGAEALKKVVITERLFINQLIKALKIRTTESNLREMRLNRSEQVNMVLLTKEEKEIPLVIVYDTLYNIGYVEYSGNKYSIEYDFFRLIGALNEYEKVNFNVEEATNFFKAYNYTPCFKINTLSRILPDNLKHQVTEPIEKIYWAYNNELSKDIGLDMTPYLGKEVSCEIYYLKESLPEYMAPRLDARGILIKYENKVIGAYLDAGRHSGFATSLKQRRIEDVTQKNWDDWIVAYSDQETPLEKELAQMTPEEIVYYYYEAINTKDKKVYNACRTRQSITEDLFGNMDNHSLFNNIDEEKNIFSFIESIEVISVSPSQEISANNDEKIYSVELHYEVTKDSPIIDSGKDFKQIYLKKEGTVWKVAGEGH